MKYKITFLKESYEEWGPIVAEANTKDDLIDELINLLHGAAGYYISEEEE